MSEKMCCHLYAMSYALDHHRFTTFLVGWTYCCIDTKQSLASSRRRMGVSLSYWCLMWSSGFGCETSMMDLNKLGIRLSLWLRNKPQLILTIAALQCFFKRKFLVLWNFPAAWAIKYLCFVVRSWWYRASWLCLIQYQAWYPSVRNMTCHRLLQ